MKKVILCLAFCVALMSSCSTLRTATSKSIGIRSSIESTTTVDLEVAQQKVEYIYTPSRKERKKLSYAKITEKAVATALKANNNADVMVAPEFVVERRGLAKRVRQITVIGYPAKYKNFQ
ncbi:MAG: hypothetical protein R3Y08_00565 [Rikenellaceae bacterium]